MERTKVVVRYRNGRVIKGLSYNFFPNKNRFHVFPADNPSGKATEVLLEELKAVFTVRDFIGNPQYNERKEYIEGEKPPGRKVEVTFEDGEVLVGSSLGCNPNQPCFCIFPADPKSNNMRVFVILSAVKNIRYLDSTQKSFADRLYCGAHV
jgi:hypothetical protein